MVNIHVAIIMCRVVVLVHAHASNFIHINIDHAKGSQLNHKILMTIFSDSVLVEYHRVAMIHMLYTTRKMVPIKK